MSDRTLRLSPAVTFHARGDAIFTFHGTTGDVCEMSRDVAALCLAFARPSRGSDALARVEGGEQLGSFLDALVERLVLEDPAAPPPALGRFRPYVPRFAVYERTGEDALVYGRKASLFVAAAAPLLDAADGSRTLDDLLALVPRLGDRRRALSRLLPLVGPDFAALKLLPPGAGVPPWAESTMPWPRLDVGSGGFDSGAPTPPAASDLAGYHARIADAEAQFDETETTLSHLFREPHAALGGETFGQRLGGALVARGAMARGARVLEVGGGLGFVAAALALALRPASYVIVDRSPALSRAQRRRGLDTVVGDALRLPIADGAIDLVVANEMCGDLPGAGETDARNNDGALALVDECARVLAPGGLAYVSEFGHPTRPPTRSDHLDHDERSIRFSDLRARARARGLDADLVPLARLLRLDGEPLALSTTRASFAALRALFRHHGGDLSKRAWLWDELAAHAAAHGVDLSAVHGVVVAPLGERTMGLLPNDFWALVARKPPS